MEYFFNEINQSIAILDEDFNFKFCNNKLLNEIGIKEDEIDNILLNTLTKEILYRNLRDSNKYAGIIKAYICDKYLKLHSTVIKSTKENKVSYYMIVDKIGKTGFEVYKGKLNDNIDKVINTEQYYIEILETMKSNLESNLPIYNTIGDINHKDFVDGLISELYKIELVQTSFSLFLNLSTDFAGSIDKKGNIMMIEGTWTKTIGWEYEELVNINLVDLIHPDYKEYFKQKLNNPSSEIMFIENKVKCKNGNYKWLRWNMKYLKGIELIVLTVKDITMEKEEQKRILELKKEIEYENLKNQFFANLSHEFKTPLNIILGIVQLLDKNIDNEKIYCDKDINLSNHIKLIRQNGYRLLRLSNNLIDMSKIDAGYYRLRLSNNNIVNVVEEISLSVAEYASKDGINLIFDTCCEELFINCDPDIIERILLNLLSNSIKNTDFGGTIYVDLSIDEDNVTICVGDNGKGIPEDKLTKIFNRFEQVEKTLHRSYEGSGIGLSLVKSLVDMHGGSINVRSKLGVGSEFKFTIPKNLVSDGITSKFECILSENKIERCNIEFSDIYI